MSRRVIPLADPRPLLGVARRTAVIRFGAAAGLVVLAVAAILAARHPHAREARFLPEGSNGIVVLDLSASISTETYSRIGQTLDELSRTRGRYGLVVFSDAAYQALPPGSPASALRPLVRYFTLPPQERPGVAPTFPVNPWTGAFSAGTRISTGLELARSILIGDRLARPAVLLVSDLDDAPGDLPALADIALAYRQEGIRLHVVGLNPAAEDEQLFRRFAGGNGSFSHARLPAEGGVAAVSTPFPWTLVVVALGLVALLAVNELANARLDWRARDAVS
ncbi:MAG: vWA domain-containing protein [Gaiellaceae bacterium]